LRQASAIFEALGVTAFSSGGLKGTGVIGRATRTGAAFNALHA
jgi:hypothetical protein